MTKRNVSYSTVLVTRPSTKTTPPFPAFQSHLPFSRSPHHRQPPTATHPPTSAAPLSMSGNYGFPNYNYNQNRPHDPSQSRQPPPAPQAPQYAHGHQTYTPHPYQNLPHAQYMAPYQPYTPQPYPPHQPYPTDNVSRVDYSSYHQAPQPNQPPRQAPPQTDQYAPPAATASMYSSWDERSRGQTSRGFNEDDEKNAAISAFKRFDQDAGGYLDLQEFMDALRALHLAISYHEALDCFVRCDVNEDGRITQDEFVRIYVDEKRKAKSENRPFSMPYAPPPNAPPPPMRQ